MADSSYENVGKYFVDRFYVVHKAGDKRRFIGSLLEICKREEVEVIIPSTETELMPLAENLKIFNDRNINVAVSDPDFLDIVKNKRSLYEFLAENMLPALPLLDITDSTLKHPVIGKPIYGFGGRGVLFFNSYDEMLEHNINDLKENFVWQPLLSDFEEYSADFAIGFDEKTLGPVIRLRTGTVGGFAAVAEGAVVPEIREIVDTFLGLSIDKGARGIFNIQVLKKGSDYYVSDVNPRIGTSAVFGYNMGVNFPLFLCSGINPDIYAPPSSPGYSSERLKMVRYLEELWIEKEIPEEIAAIVFDLDDTLINQKIWIADKLEILLSMLGDVLPEQREFLSSAFQIIEEGNRSRLFDALSERFQFSDNLRLKLIETYRQITPPSCPLFPDVLPVLKELKGSGFKLALLTDNPPDSQREKVRVCNLDKIFDTIVYSEELSPGKPDRTVFEEVGNRLKTHGHSMIMVGDNLYKDVIGALDAGYRSAYWLTREGTFFNFDQTLLDRIFKERHNFKKIDNLRYLLWSLLEDNRDLPETEALFNL
jgi:FMN phosphatase YigB (HAD superfamily)